MLQNKNLIVFLVFVLLCMSIVMPSVVYFKYSDEIRPEDSFSVAQVSLTVVSSDGGEDGGDGGGGSGGGGGGGGGVSIVTHLIDFTGEIVKYTIEPRKRDMIKILFVGGAEYSFTVSKFNWADEIVLKSGEDEYQISYDEIAYFDLDGDGGNDISINFVSDRSIKVRRLAKAEELGDKEIDMNKEKLRYPSLTIPGVGIEMSILFIFVLIAMAILIVFVYHNIKLRRFEKTHKNRLTKIYSKYREKRKTREEKLKTKKKFTKQLNTLEKAYKSGYVSDDSYKKGRKRINGLIRKL